MISNVGTKTSLLWKIQVIFSVHDMILQDDSYKPTRTGYESRIYGDKKIKYCEIFSMAHY